MNAYLICGKVYMLFVNMVVDKGGAVCQFNCECDGIFFCVEYASRKRRKREMVVQSVV
jgi:hypothetical protein